MTGTDWRDIHGYEGHQVSAEGYVKRKAQVVIRAQKRVVLPEMILKPRISPSQGHLIVNVRHIDGERSQLRMDIVMARAFLGPRPTGNCVRYKDGNRENIHIDNLEYIKKPPKTQEPARDRNPKSRQAREEANWVVVRKEGVGSR